MSGDHDRALSNKNYPELPHPQAPLLQDWIDGMAIQYRDENGEWVTMPRALDYFGTDFRAAPDNINEINALNEINATETKPLNATLDRIIP